MKIIARIYNDFKEKFGIPRQSGLADTRSVIKFEKEYQNPDAVRGIEGFSHLWLIWEFSEAKRESWSATVRPPRLGGNKKMGVFATRSPYRPNPIGLSSVKLIEVKRTENDGTVLVVEGADILNGTPIYDIKPYLSFCDSHPDAIGGFADGVKDYSLRVVIPDSLSSMLSHDDLKALKAILENDPRPSYQTDQREYGMSYGEYEIKFTVKNGTLTVENITK